MSSWIPDISKIAKEVSTFAEQALQENDSLEQSKQIYELQQEIAALKKQQIPNDAEMSTKYESLLIEHQSTKESLLLEIENINQEYQERDRAQQEKYDELANTLNSIKLRAADKIRQLMAKNQELLNSEKSSVSLLDNNDDKSNRSELENIIQELRAESSMKSETIQQLETRILELEANNVASDHSSIKIAELEAKIKESDEQWKVRIEESQRKFLQCHEERQILLNCKETATIELNELKKLLQQAQADLKVKDQSTNELQIKNESLLKEKVKSVSDLEAMSKSMQDMEQELELTKTESCDIQENHEMELQECNIQIAGYKTQLGRLESKVSEIPSLLRRIQELEQIDSSSLQLQIEDLIEKVESGKKQIEKLSAKNNVEKDGQEIEYQLQIEDLTCQLRFASEEINRLRNTLESNNPEELAQTIQTLETELGSARIEASKLRQLESQNEEMQRIINSTKEEITRLEVILASNESEKSVETIESLKAELESTLKIACQVNQKESQIQELQSNLDLANKEIAKRTLALEGDLATANENHATAEAQIQELKAKLKISNDQFIQLQASFKSNNIDDLTQKIKELEAELETERVNASDEYHAQTAALKTKITLANEEISHLQAALESNNAEELVQTINQLKTELRESKSDISGILG